MASNGGRTCAIVDVETIHVGYKLGFGVLGLASCRFGSPLQRQLRRPVPNTHPLQLISGKAQTITKALSALEAE